MKGLVQQSKINLRREICNFREQLDSINSSLFSWGYAPEHTFKNKEKFPIDFQIFMEEIGPNHSEGGRRHGYQILHLESPTNSVHSELDNEQFQIRNLGCFQREEICIIAQDVDMQNYGFILTEAPYQFFSAWGKDWLGDDTVGISFWSWFRKHMLDSIDYIDPDLASKFKN